MTDTPNRAGDPMAELERAYIAEFLQRRGHTLESLHDLPEAAAHDLMKAASTYASGRLTEVESRSHYIDDVHGGSDGKPGHGPGSGSRG
jgi:hypothetical protein